MAEACVVLEGLRLAHRLGVRKVMVESDRLHVIEAVKFRSSGANDFHLIIDDVLSLLVALM